MKKSISEIIDSLITCNIKIFFLIEKIQDGKATIEDAQKTQVLNKQRSQLMNAINVEMNEKGEIIKV